MRYVVAVAEERSFTRAAARCHVDQSSLRHQVKAVGRELGVELFARTSRRVEVTAAGEAFSCPQAALVAVDRAAGDAADAGLTTIPVTDGPTRSEHLAWSAFNPSPAALAFTRLLLGERAG